MLRLKENGEYSEYRAKEKERLDQWSKDNAQHISNYQKKYHVDHKEHRNENCKQNYYINHDKRLAKQKKYYQNHKNETSAYYRNKRKTDPIYRLKSTVRSCIKDSFKRRKFTKNNFAAEITGLNSSDLCDHLLKSFKQIYGYEWDGIEPVDIDHIIPLATAKTEDDILKLCHYSNLQLLKSSDNRSKQDKINFIIRKEK